jgi:lipopolysaccharide transport system ATP-binding protein
VRQERLAGGQVRTISGTGEVGFADIALLNEQGQRVEVLSVGGTATLRVVVDVKTDIPRLVLGFMIKDRMGQPIYGINTHRTQQALENLRAGERITYDFRFPVRLGKGNYSIALSLSRFDSHLDKNYEWRDYALVFHVINVQRPDFVGCAWLDAQIAIERSGAAIAESCE